MRRHLDLWTVGFLAVMLAALTLTSVGTFEFFSFILPAGLAFAATVVLAAGIPLLKFAAVFDARRAGRYGLIMWAFLAVELLAQYFKAQASFAPKVAAAREIAASDLAAAAANGYASRVLAFVFLASLPFVVVAMCQAAADRLARRRAVFARIRDGFAALRAEAVRLRADLAAARAETAPVRAELEEARARVAQYEDWLRQARTELERERARPVLSVETAARLLVARGAPETTIRGWLPRLKEVEE